MIREQHESEQSVFRCVRCGAWLYRVKTKIGKEYVCDLVSLIMVDTNTNELTVGRVIHSQTCRPGVHQDKPGPDFIPESN